MFGIGEIASLIDNVIERIWPNKTEVEKAKIDQIKSQLLAELALQLGQIKVNESEASNPSVFVSGWRPYAGWLCNVALTLSLVQVIIGWVLFGLGKPPLPEADFTLYISILGGLLGLTLGVARTVEKTRGVARK